MSAMEVSGEMIVGRITGGGGGGGGGGSIDWFIGTTGVGLLLNVHFNL
jgi:hypothetical protein